MSNNARFALGALLLCVFAVLARGLQIDTDLRSLLPDQGAEADAFAIVEEFHIADALLFEVDGSESTEATLVAETHKLAAALRAIDGIGVVQAEATLNDALALETAIAPHAAAFLSDAQLKKALSTEGLRKTFSGHMALLAAGGALGESQLTRDPLGLHREALRTIQGSGNDFGAKRGLLRDATGKRTIVAVWPSIASNEIGPNHPLVPSITAAVEASELPVQWLGGHRVAAATASAVSNDITFALRFGSLALLLVLFVGFRTVRPLIAAAGAVSLALSAGAVAATWLSPVHGIAISFASALTGLAVDTWIHLHAAASVSNAPPERAFEVAWKRLRGPILLSMSSTAVAFALLATSKVPVISALGGIGLATIIGAVLGTWLFGPVLLRMAGNARLDVRDPAGLASLAPVAVAAIVVVGLGASWVTFNSDPRALLAVSPEVAADEQALVERYDLSTTRALVVVQDASADHLLTRARRLERAVAEHPITDVRGPGMWAPSDEHRAHLQAELPSEPELQQRIDAAAADIGFTGFPGAAAAVIAQLKDPVPQDLWASTALAPMVGRHLRQTGDGSRGLISIGLPTENVAPAVEDTIRTLDPEAIFLQPAKVAETGLDRTRDEMTLAGGVAVLLLSLMLAMRYRDTERVFAAILPCGAGVLAALGAHGWLGIALNPVALAGMVLVVGLGLDYGVFMVETRGDGDHARAARGAVLLSAATTVVGFGSLLTAKSPAVSGLGLSVTTGLSTAALFAVVVVPAMLRADAPFPGVRTRRWALRAALVLLVLAHADLLVANLVVPLPPCDDCSPSISPVVAIDKGWQLDDNRLTRHHGIWLLETEGDSYQTGVALGRLGAPLRVRLENEMFSSFHNAVPNPLARAVITRGAMIAGSSLGDYIEPAHLAEIQGQCDATQDHVRFHGPLYSRKLLYQAVHDFGQALVDTPLLGCTAIAAGASSTADGHWLLARNFDFDGAEAMDRDKVVRVHRPQQGYAHLTVSFLGLGGAVSGFNEQGLAVAINAGGSDAPPRPATPMTLLVREILEQASSLDEAEHILSGGGGFVSENVLVVDAEAGEVAVFEVSPERVVRLTGGDHIAVSNHFRDPSWSDDATNTRRIEELTTVPRLQRAEELLNANLGTLTPADARAILRDRSAVGGVPLPRGHRHALDADLATHAVVFDVTTRTAWVSRYPHLSAGWMEVSLTDVLAGTAEPLMIEQPDTNDDALDALKTRQMRSLVREARSLSAASALPLLHKAVTLRPGHPEPLLELGRVHAELHHTEEARIALSAALAAPLEYAHQEREALTLLESLP